MNETPAKHDGELDDYEVSDRHAEVFLVQHGIMIGIYGDKGHVLLDAKQALSLLAWLKQEELPLHRLAKKGKAHE